MIIHDTQFGDKLFIYKDGLTRQQTIINMNKKIIDNRQYLICGSSGSGKSVFTNTLVYEFYKHGYTVIYVTAKPGNELDNAFCIFPVDRSYHLEILKRQRQDPLPIEKIENLAKFYHPLSFHIKHEQYGLPVKYFTFPIKSLTEEALSSIYAGDVDQAAVRKTIDELRNLKDKSTIYDLMIGLGKKLKEENTEESLSMESFGVNIQSTERKDVLKAVFDSMKPFRQHYMLREETCPYNIDYYSIINDQKSMHFLSTKYISEKRVRYFVYIMFLQGLLDALNHKAKVNYPVLLVFEEIKILLPKSAEVSYEKQLAKIIRELLSRIRAAGKGVTTIATTQEYFSTNKEYRGGVDNNDIFLGKLNENDQKNFKITNPSLAKTDERNLLASINTGQFVNLGMILRGRLRKGFANVPPFKFAEETDDFMALYKKNYPNKLVNNTTFLKTEEAIHKKLEREILDNQKEIFANKKTKEKLEEQKAKEIKEKINLPIAEAIKETKKIDITQDIINNSELLTIEGFEKKDKYTKSELMKICYTIKKKYNVSFFQISKMTGVPLIPIMRSTLQYTEIVNDVKFARELLIQSKALLRSVQQKKRPNEFYTSILPDNTTETDKLAPVQS